MDTTSTIVGMLYAYNGSASHAECFATEAPDLDSGTTVSQKLTPGCHGDSVSISDKARSLYAGASGSDGLVTTAGLAPENISLYNRIRRERDSLDPGDPRVIELSQKLRALLGAERPMSSDEIGFFARFEALAPLSGSTSDGSFTLLPEPDASRVSVLNHQAVREDSSALAPPLSFTGPDSSPDVPLRLPHASSSASGRLYGHVPGNSAEPHLRGSA